MFKKVLQERRRMTSAGKITIIVGNPLLANLIGYKWNSNASTIDSKHSKTIRYICGDIDNLFSILMVRLLAIA